MIDYYGERQTNSRKKQNSNYKGSKTKNLVFALLQFHLGS